MSEQVGCTPTSSIGELFLAHMCICCMAIPTPHIISIIWLLLPMIVLIDVSLSHLFFFLLHHISLIAILIVNFRAYAHPLQECSKYQKWVDKIDLYLASGLGTSQDKIPEEDQVWNFSRLSSQHKNPFSRIPYPLSCTQTPFGDIRVTDSEISST